MISRNRRTVGASTWGVLKSISQIFPPSRKKMLRSHFSWLAVGSRQTVLAAIVVDEGFFFLPQSAAMLLAVARDLVPVRSAVDVVEVFAFAASVFSFAQAGEITGVVKPLHFGF